MESPTSRMGETHRKLGVLTNERALSVYSDGRTKIEKRNRVIDRNEFVEERYKSLGEWNKNGEHNLENPVGDYDSYGNHELEGAQVNNDIDGNQ